MVGAATAVQAGAALSSSPATTPSVIQAPCVPDATFASSGPNPSFLRKCSDVLNGMPGTGTSPASPASTGSTAIPLTDGVNTLGVIPMLDQQVKLLVDAPTHSLYQGQNPDPNSPNPSNPVMWNFGTPVCNPVANPFNSNQPELTSNHHQQSCGQPAHFVVTARKSGIHADMILSSPYGTTEGAYIRGSWIQALTCHWQEVRNEIQRNQALNITQSCSAIATSLQAMQTSSLQTAQQIVSQLGSQANISDIWNCTIQGYSPVNTSSPDVGPLRQSAQHLCATRASLEKMFAELAMCEVTTRAGRAYRSLAQSPSSLIQSITSGAVTATEKQCLNYCKSRCDSEGSCSQCGTACANNSYPAQLQQFFASKLAVWPNNGSCTL